MRPDRSAGGASASGNHYVGIDGCRGGWFFTVIDHASVVEADVTPDIQRLWDRFHNADLLLIDIPLGLSDQPSRLCDIEARKLLGPGQGARVFPAPCRKAVYAATYELACTINHRQTGKKISRQTWNIVPKIREVDAFMRSNPTAQGKLRESHPEICFRALSGSPLLHGKKTPQGVAERLGVLESHLNNLHQAFESALKRVLRKHASRDDILDSLVTAVTARYASCRALTLPSTPPSDSEGLPMEMVYALRD